MTLNLSGSNGISGVDGSAGTPALQGTDANTGISFPAADTVAINTGGSERTRVDSSGRLLVGTSSSSAAASLVCQGTSASSTAGSQIWLQRGQAAASIGTDETLGRVNFADNAGNAYAFIEGGTNGSGGSNDYPGKLVFSVTRDGSASPTERMRVGNDGSFSSFAVDYNGAFQTAASAGTTYSVLSGWYGATSNLSGGTNSFRVWSNGNVQNTNNSYTALSDAKLKENIVDAGSQWSDLKALRVRNYNLKEGQTHRQIGLVAQEVELISPGLVYETPDRDAEGNDLGTTTKAVQYSVLYMKAVKALQEAMERIETLQGMVAVNNITIDEQQHQISALAARLTALESA